MTKLSKRAQAAARITEALALLPSEELDEQEDRTLRLRFGIDPYDTKLPVAEVSAILGVTRKRAGEIELAGLGKLLAALARKKALAGEGTLRPDRCWWCKGDDLVCLSKTPQTNGEWIPLCFNCAEGKTT